MAGQIEIPLLEAATGSTQYDYSLNIKNGNEGRLLFSLKMDQVVAFNISCQDIKCKMTQELTSPFYAFQMILSVK